jgi:hypothetical protein
MAKMRNAQNKTPENLNGRDHSGDLGVDGKIILEWM